MKSGGLFAGVGGLDMAVNEVFGAEPAWFAEFDEAPSKVLAYRFPSVPNYGDVTKIDWATVPRVDILCGGFPCQDLSLAGRRNGMRPGTRSGLWADYLRAIDALRPDWVVIENVRGLLSGCAESEADSDLGQCPRCADPSSGVGHAPNLRALGRVLGDLAGIGFDAEWTGLPASSVGAPHGRFRVFILAWPRERTLADAPGQRRQVGVSGRPEEGSPTTPSDNDDAPVTLLPTPRTTDMNGPGAHGQGGMDLRTAVLMPTPTVGNATGGNAQRGGARGDEKLLPGLARDHATDWGPYAAAVERWTRVLGRPAPSPVRMDGKGGKARLNPELPEWMMGWPAGWVTDPAIGLTRAQQLKACGNGVVPQQAVAAIHEMLARPGVPQIRRDAA